VLLGSITYSKKASTVRTLLEYPADILTLARHRSEESILSMPDQTATATDFRADIASATVSAACTVFVHVLSVGCFGQEP
jgi:hypothetical protein